MGNDKGFGAVQVPIFSYEEYMLEAGLEPARDCSQEILSLLCLPFHHSSVDRERNTLTRMGVKCQS